MSESNTHSSLIDRLNWWETYKMYAILTDKYKDFIKAFSRKNGSRKADEWGNPNFHNFWMSQVDEDVRRISGEYFGTNPHSALHPIMRLINAKFNRKEA